MEIVGRLFLTLLTVNYLLTDAQEEMEDVPAKSDCYDKMLEENPSLKNRFSDELLQHHCQKSASWKKQSLDSLSKSVKPLLSSAQRDWANSIWNCKDLKCFCGLFDFCKDLLKQVEALSNATKIGQNGEFKVPDLGSVASKGGGLGELLKGGRKKRQAENDVNLLLRDKVGKAVRKEIRAMSNGERNRFMRTLNRLKTEKIDNLSKYDIMIIYHTPEYSPEAHFCSAFLPFHRELLKNLEMAMRVVDPDVALPYWDTTLDEGLPDPKDSVLWTDDFLGNGNGEVTSGPFANWTTVPDSKAKTLSNSNKIVRNLGGSPFSSLMKDKDLDTLMAKTSFSQFSYCVDPFFELIHGATHMWVGGHMLELRISPNDPSFFLFHCFVDYIWEQWRQQKQTRQVRETEYANTQQACNQFCYGTEQMKPFPLKISEGLSNRYTDQLYGYEPRPVCSPQNPSCGSQYLFCDTRRFKCLSKVKVNGNCNGFDSADICFQSRCSNGRCIASDPVVTQPPGPATPSPLIPATPPTIAKPTTIIETPRPPLFTVPPTLPQRKMPTTMQPPIFVVTVVPPPIVTIAPPPIVTVIPPPLVTAAHVPFTRFPASSKTVWTPITILTVSGQNAQPYPLAKIVSNDADHSAQFFGRVADPKQVPYYSGAAYAQILNPFTVEEPIEATIEVFDASDTKCLSLCLNDKLIYAPCQPKAHLYTDPKRTNNVPFTNNLEMAKFLNWNGNTRSPDKFLFLCSAVSDTGSQPRVLFTEAPILEPNVPRSLPKAPEPPAPQTLVTSAPETMTTAQTSIKFLGDKSKPGAGDEVIVRIITKNELKNHRGNGGCQNFHRCCPIWAHVGECLRNPWMQNSCQKECNACNSGLSDTPTTECSDYHPSCEKWAGGDQCKANMDWMEENCRSSCKVCDRSVDELKKLCGGSPKSVAESGCQNFHDNCGEWSKQDECQRNPWWMKENCPLACKTC